MKVLYISAYIRNYDFNLMVAMRTVYSRGKPKKILVVTFSRSRMAMFKEVLLRNVGFTEISKEYGITKDRARKTSGQFVYWLKRLAQDMRDEEMETIILRRATFERKKSVRQYLESYGQLILEKIDYYEKTGRIKFSDDDSGTKHEWILPGDSQVGVRVKKTVPLGHRRGGDQTSSGRR